MKKQVRYTTAGCYKFVFSSDRRTLHILAQRHEHATGLFQLSRSLARLQTEPLGLPSNNIGNLVLQALALRTPAEILPRTGSRALRVQAPRRVPRLRFNFLHIDLLDGRLLEEALAVGLVGNPLGHLAPDVHTVLGEEVGLGPEELRVDALLGVQRGVDEQDEQVAEVVDVHVVPLRLARVDVGDVPLAQAVPGELVDLNAALIDGPAAGSVDGGRADDGRLDRRIRGGGLQDDLVDVAVIGFIR